MRLNLIALISSSILAIMGEKFIVEFGSSKVRPLHGLIANITTHNGLMVPL